MIEKHEHQWSPITDITESEAKGMAVRRLESLEDSWRDRRSKLESDGDLEKFEARLRREIAIETGLIERLYQFDRGVTETLVEQGIDQALIPHDAGSAPGLIVAMIRDADRAMELLFSLVANRQPLTSHVIHQLHAVVTKSQPTTRKLIRVGEQEWFEEREFKKGAFKDHPNSVKLADGRMHEYCPPIQVESEMENLLRWHARHETEQYPPEVSAAWLHHRFTQIHHYEDGNGRVARLLASIVLIKAGWFPLVLTSARNEDYRAALLTADQGNLGPLVTLFAEVIEAGFLKALDVAPPTLKNSPIDAILAAVGKRLGSRRTDEESRWRTVDEIGRSLESQALSRFQEIQARLKAVDSSFRVNLSHPGDPWAQGKGEDFTANFNRHQIVQTARTLGYFANPSLFHRWVVLKIDSPTRSEVMLSIHGPSREFSGQLIASMIFYRREQDAEGSFLAVDITVACRTPFLISYADDVDELRSRFAAWLDDSLAIALAFWQQNL